MNRRLEDSALRFAQECAGQDAPSIARQMMAFVQFCNEKTGQADAPLEHALRRIDDPPNAIPKAVEHMAHARSLLGQAPSDETLFMSRELLADALTLLGRKDLLQ